MANQKKPFWRLRNIVLVFVVTPLLVILISIGWAVTRPPGMEGKYAEALELLVISRQSQKGPNAWPLMLEAIDARAAAENEFVASRTTANQFAPVVGTIYEAWWIPAGDKDTEPRTDTERRSDAKAVIEELRAKGVLDKFAALVHADWASRPKPVGAVYSVLLPELGMMRQSARMLAARYSLAAEEGNVDEMIASYEQLLAIARIAKAQFTLIDFLVGTAIESLANDRAREMLIRHPVEGEKGVRLAKGLLAAMEREQALMARVDHALQGERLAMLDTVEWTHTDDGSGGGVLIVSLLDQMAGGVNGAPNLSGMNRIGGAIAGLAFRGKAGTVAQVNTVMDKVIAGSRVPRPSRDLSRIEADMMGTMSWRDRFMTVMVPALGKSVMSQDQNDLAKVGLRTMLALELFRIREGHYPARLEELVGLDLPLLPEDPIAGGPLRYKRLGNGVVDPSPWIDASDPMQKPDTRGYMLYSIGDDGIDNGGMTRTSSGNYDALGGRGKPRAQGIDYQINLKPDAPR